MSSTFWTNTVWYILLGIISISEFVFVLIKVKKFKLTFALFMIIFGIALNVETTILILLKSYTYFPMIFNKTPHPYDDVLMGNIFSQFSVSVTILLVVMFDLKFYWYFIAAAIYGWIEEFFLELGIYSHNWYRTWMTVALSPLAIWIIKKIYKQIIKGIKPLYYYFYVYMGLFPLYVITILFGFELAGFLAFKKNIVPDPIDSYYLLALILFFVLPSILMILLYFLRIKWRWKALVIAMLYTLYIICYKYHWIWVKDGWFHPFCIITIVWIYSSVYFLDWLYGGIKK